MNKLTPRQEKFAQKYVETGNASEAYRHAYSTDGWKPESINVNASKMLSDAKVSQRVKELQAEHKKRHEITVDDITEGLKQAIGLALSKEDVTNLRNGYMDLAKLHGLLSDKIDHQGNVTVTLNKISKSAKDRD